MKDEFPYSRARDIEVEVNGKKVKGYYALDRGIITVRSINYGSKSAHLGGLSEEGLAKQLLRELAG